MLGVEFSPPLFLRFAQNASLSPREEKEVSRLGLEPKKFAVNLNLGEKTAFLLRLVQDPAAR